MGPLDGEGVKRYRYLVEKNKRCCIFAAMSTGKTQESAAKLTQYIENQRKERKKTASAMAKAMGIDRGTYSRKLENHNGFTDLEICRAMSFLGLRMYVTTQPIENHLHNLI